MSQPLERRVAAFVRRSALITPDDAVLALVSGGADSLCLLDVLRRVHPGRLGVLTMDHGLRPAAAGECERVRATAQALGLEAWTEQLQVAPGANLQARARELRRDVAERVRRRHGFTLIALGHTASDQAETVLLNLVRGAGRSGAGAMTARRDATVRPLLCVTRDEARAWCVEHDLPFVDDPSNDDERFRRVRVRHELMPALERIHPGAARALSRFAEQMRDEAELLEPLIAAAWQRCDADGGLATAPLRAEPPALARILIHRLLRDGGVSAGAEWVAQAFELAQAGRGRFDAQGASVAVEDGRLVVAPAAPTAPPALELRPAAAPTEVCFGPHRIRMDRGPAGAWAPSRLALRHAEVLHVRSMRPGDRIGLAGGGHAKVARVLAQGGVPEHRRPQVPIVVDDTGRVVWVAGYRADPDALAAPGDPAIRLEMV